MKVFFILLLSRQGILGDELFMHYFRFRTTLWLLFMQLQIQLEISRNEVDLVKSALIPLSMM